MMETIAHILDCKEGWSSISTLQDRKADLQHTAQNKITKSKIQRPTREII